MVVEALGEVGTADGDEGDRPRARKTTGAVSARAPSDTPTAHTPRAGLGPIKGGKIIQVQVEEPADQNQSCGLRQDAGILLARPREQDGALMSLDNRPPRLIASPASGSSTEESSRRALALYGRAEVNPSDLGCLSGRIGRPRSAIRSSTFLMARVRPVLV